MKTQVKVLALALAVAMAAGSANAAIETGITGNGEIWMSAWDAVANVAYSKDTGINMNDFLAGSPGAMENKTISLAGDANWTRFLANSTAANTTWMMGATDQTGAGAGGSRALTTSKVSLATIKTQTNSNFESGVKGVDVYEGAINDYGTHPTLTDGSAYNVIGDINAFPVGGVISISNWSTKAPWSAAAALGESMKFYYVTSSGGLGLNKVSASQFMLSDNSGAASWTLNATTNSLAFEGAAQVVPIPAAAWLLGSALMGLVGFSRRRNRGEVVAA